MNSSIRIPQSIWDELMKTIETRFLKGSLEKPLVFALYTTVKDHTRVIEYKEIPTVEVIGTYPGVNYTYKYPGIKKRGFYPPKNAGKWFSGTLVVGDTTEADEEDMELMKKEELYFRIKMDKDNSGKLTQKTYLLSLPTVPLVLD